MAGNFPGDMYTQPPLPAGETFLGYASREPGRLRIGRTLQNPVAGAEVHPDCVAAYEEASALLASLGHEVEDIGMPLGPDVVPFFETLWYAYATLAPLAPEQEEVLLPLTRYLRGRGMTTNAPELIFAQDMARRISLALENARLYREAQEANRAKDEFLATLSHELRTPLNAILGWTQILRAKRLDEVTTARAFEAIERNAKAQAELIEDMLDVSRIITGRLRLDMQPVRLSSAVEAALDSVRPTAEAKGVRIECDLAPDGSWRRFQSELTERLRAAAGSLGG